MDRSRTVSWAISVCAVYLRLSQAKTLATLVAGARSLGPPVLGLLRCCAGWA